MAELLAIDREALRIAEVPTVQVLVLRLGPEALSVLPALETLLGAPLPTVPNQASGTDPRLCWLAPREWAIVSREPEPALAERIGAAAAGALHHVADQAWACFAIEGAAARDLLAAGCTLDLHPRAFAPGACAQTLLAQMPILIDAPAPDRFLVHVDRSLAAHMRAWLADAAATIGRE